MGKHKKHIIKRKFLVIPTIIIFNSFELLAYQPAKNIEILQIQSIKESSLIFLGELISTDSAKSIVTYRIFKKYKGDYNQDTISVNFSEENADIYPNKGLWIVYLYQTNDSKFHVYRNLSRSMYHPEYLFIWPYLRKLNDKSYDKNEIRIDAINDWFLEVEKLKKLNRTEVKTETIKEKNLFPEKLVTISIIFSVVNFLILIYLLTKKNASR